VWNSTKNGVTSERGVERRFFMSGDVEAFCTEFVKGGSEGLCECVGEGVLPDKADMCFRVYTVTKKYLPIFPDPG